MHFVGDGVLSNNGQWSLWASSTRSETIYLFQCREIDGLTTDVLRSWRVFALILVGIIVLQLVVWAPQAIRRDPFLKNLISEQGIGGLCSMIFEVVACSVFMRNRLIPGSRPTPLVLNCMEQPSVPACCVGTAGDL